MVQGNDNDFYNILGVSKHASQEEIGKAYRKLVRLHHPDRFNDENEKKKANTKMQKINQAYQTLSNQKKKKEYDEYRRIGGQPSQYQQYSSQQQQQRHETPFFQGDRHEDFQFGQDFRKFFDQFFEFGSNSHSSYYSHEKTHQVINYPKVEISLTILEWYNGVNKKITYRRKIKCKHCQIKTVACTSCGGSGYTVIRAFIQIQTECNKCKGTGTNKVIYGCGQCNNGSVSEDTTITIQIPACCQKRHIIEGVGDFNGKTYNNLEICISVIESELFKIEGQHLKTIIKIGLEEFIYGTKVLLNHLNGEKISLDLPPLNTDDLIIQYKGFKNNKESHLIIKIAVINNSKHLPINKVGFVSQFQCQPMSNETHRRI